MTARFFFTLAFCTIAFSAFAEENEIAVPAHDIARGTPIAEGDFVLKAAPVARISDGVLRSPADAIGKEARRASDLKRPPLVIKGATVTMVFETPGMQLTAPGRALGEAGEGETVTVLNPTSYRQVEGVAIAPGTVRVGALGLAPKKLAMQP